jgi:hypothetical protein
MTRVMKAAIKSPKGGKFVFMRKCEKMEGGPLLVMSMPGKKVSRNLIKDVRKGSKPILGVYRLDESGMVCFYPQSKVNPKQMTMAITKVAKLYKVRIPKNKIRILDEEEPARVQAGVQAPGPSERDIERDLRPDEEPEMVENSDAEFSDDSLFSDDEDDSNVDGDAAEEALLASLPPEAMDEDGFLTPLGVELMRQKAEEAAVGAEARRGAAEERLSEATAERERLDADLDGRVESLGKNRKKARALLRKLQTIERLRREIAEFEKSLAGDLSVEEREGIQAKMSITQTRLDGLDETSDKKLKALIIKARNAQDALMAEERQVATLKRESERASALEEARLRARDAELRLEQSPEAQERDRELSVAVQEADAAHKEALRKKHEFDADLEALDRAYVERLMDEMDHAEEIAILETRVESLEARIRALTKEDIEDMTVFMEAKQEMVACEKALNRLAIFRPANAQASFDRALALYEEALATAHAGHRTRKRETRGMELDISRALKEAGEIKARSDAARDEASLEAQMQMRNAPEVLIDEAASREALAEAGRRRQSARISSCRAAVQEADTALQSAIPDEGPLAEANAEALTAKEAYEVAVTDLEQGMSRFNRARAAQESINWSMDGRPLPDDLGEREAVAEDYARGLALLQAEQRMAHDLTVLRLALTRAEADMLAKDASLKSAIRGSAEAEVQAALEALETRKHAMGRAKAERDRCSLEAQDARHDLADARTRAQVETDRAAVEAEVEAEQGAIPPVSYAEEMERLGKMDILTQRSDAIASISDEAVRARVQAIVDKLQVGHDSLKAEGASPVVLQDLWQNLPRVLWENEFIKELDAWRQMEGAFAEEAKKKASEKRKKEAKKTSREAAMERLDEALTVTSEQSEEVNNAIELAASLMEAIGEDAEEKKKALEGLGEALKPLVDYSGYLAKLVEFGKGMNVLDELEEEEPDEVKRLMMEAEVMAGIGAAGELLKDLFKEGLEESAQKVFGAVINFKDMGLAIKGVYMRRKKVSQDTRMQKAAEHARRHGEGDGVLVEALDQSASREQELAWEQAATAVGEAAEGAGTVIGLTAAAAQVGAGLVVAGKTIKVGTRIVMAKVNWAHAATCKKLAEQARGGDRKAMVEIFKHSGKYAKGLLAQMCLEDSTIAINYVISRGLTEDMVETSSPEIIRLYLLKESNESDDAKTFSESMTELYETITGAFAVIGGWFSSIGDWLSETQDDARLKDFSKGYPSAQFARIITAHSRAIAGMAHVDEMDPEDRRKCEDSYVDIRMKMAEINSESQLKVSELIDMRQAMEDNLAQDASRWTPKYVENIRKTLDMHLATHTVTLQQLVDSVAAG